MNEYLDVPINHDNAYHMDWYIMKGMEVKPEKRMKMNAKLGKQIKY